MRLLLIANPIAGKNAPDQIERARRALSKLGAEVELYLTRAAGDAEHRARLARQQAYDRVIAAGGDGTLNEVANGLATSALPLGFIPLGTTNVFALETGIPFEIEQAAQIAYRERPRPVTLGKANDRYFLLMAGVGFDGQVVANVSTRIKKRFGKLAYILSALHQLLFHPPRLFSVDLNGRTLKSSGVLAANARCYGGPFTLTPAADLEKPSLEICLLLRAGRLAVLRQSLSLLTGKPLPSSWGLQATLTELTVETANIPTQIDGDHLGVSPLTISCVPQAIQLVYPATATGQGRLS